MTISQQLEEIDRLKQKIKKANSVVSDTSELLRHEQYKYRIESVNRVLDFVRSEYRAKRNVDIETLLCHCQNKLYGNIDGIELDLVKKDDAE